MYSATITIHIILAVGNFSLLLILLLLVVRLVVTFSLGWTQNCMCTYTVWPMGYRGEERRGSCTASRPPQKIFLWRNCECCKYHALSKSGNCLWLAAWKCRENLEKNQEDTNMKGGVLIYTSARHFQPCFCSLFDSSECVRRVFCCHGLRNHSQGYHQLSFLALPKADEQKSQSHLQVSSILWKHNCKFFWLFI